MAIQYYVRHDGEPPVTKDCPCAQCAGLSGPGSTVAVRLDVSGHAPQTVTRAPERRHNATCPRCFGPAYHGAGRVLCEREGGCLVDAVPARTGTVLDGYDFTANEWRVTNVFKPGRRRGESLHFAEGHGERAEHPTAAGAVTAWREAVLARAKREAGQ